MLVTLGHKKGKKPKNHGHNIAGNNLWVALETTKVTIQNFPFQGTLGML
jgi:hypothetical protein